MDEIFTFHHVSIKTLNLLHKMDRHLNSHSTMYLLKRFFHHHLFLLQVDSHSTMYLLKLICILYVLLGQVFTFHHVSIKTFNPSGFLHILLDSHSTMYLLKLCISFNHVPVEYDSHSTMYLLKQ